MYAGLERGVRERGGKASIAWSGSGRQLMEKDRQVWGALQDWLRQIFVEDCKIEGRDRRHMDELNLTCHEMFLNATFVLLFCSEKGKGKSVRAMRFAVIMPENWCSFNSANTARSGMNGNNSPANGTVVICDEMISDLVNAECNERMEYFKTIVGKREFEIERTRNVKNPDGSDSHQTYKIVTDHQEVYVICCNMGQCFTAGMEEPSPGKEALIQRTVCLQARAEATADSPDDVFRDGLKRPDVAARIADFQMLKSLEGMTLLCMKDIPWLQPDFALANLIFKEADRMLSEKYSLADPEPRRLVKRLNNLKIMCVQEAVARVFFFKQTSLAYDAGKPGKLWDIGDLWDVIRTLHPTREMILAAWSHSLEYSIGTSSHGVNVMNAICDKLGFQIDKVFRKMHEKDPATYVTSGATADTGELTQEGQTMTMMLNTKRRALAPGVDQPLGGDPVEIDRLGKELRKGRELRADFRRRALGSTLHNKTPLDAITELVPAGKTKEYGAAIFPRETLHTLHYKPKALLLWAVGKKCNKHEVEAHSSDGYSLPFRTIGRDDGESKKKDFGWLIVSSTATKDGRASWRAAGHRVKESKLCGLFDMHDAGIADCLFMLASTENKRLCPEMPSLPWTSRQENAFVDQDGRVQNKQSVMIGPTPLDHGTANATEIVNTDVVGCRDDAAYSVGTGVPLHKQLDKMHNHGRLPALLPHTSTSVERCAPLRWMDNSGLEVNAVVVYEHVMMVLEGIIRCSKIPGLKGLQERFVSGGSAPNGLLSKLPDGKPGDGVVRRMPYSVDLMQMAWTAELAEKFYNPKRASMVIQFNAMIKRDKLGEPIRDDEMPELTLKYPGFPRSGDDVRELRQISLPIGTKKPEGQRAVDIGDANPLQSIDASLLRYQCEIAIGRPASRRDIEQHRRSLIGSGYAWGVTGDVFNYDTWADHACASLIGRGNTDGAENEAAGGFTDMAFASVLDAEHMFDVRLLERRAQNPENDEHKHNIALPGGSTYGYLEAHPELDRVGKKRAAGQQAPRMLCRQRTGSQVAQSRGVRWASGSSGASAAPSPSLARAGPSMALS